jgi:hypothetical protein
MFGVVQSKASANLTGAVTFDSGVAEGNLVVLIATTYTAGGAGVLPTAPTLGGSAFPSPIGPVNGNPEPVSDTVAVAAWGMVVTGGLAGQTTLAYSKGAATGFGGCTALEISGAGATPSFSLSSGGAGAGAGAGTVVSSGPITLTGDTLVVGGAVAFGVPQTLTGDIWAGSLATPNDWTWTTWAEASSGTWAFTSTCALGSSSGWAAIVLGVTTSGGGGGGAWPDLTFGSKSTSGGIDTWPVSTVINGTGGQTVRVLPPTSGDPSAILLTLPADHGEDTTSSGDAFDICNGLGVNNLYNFTVVEASYSIDPCHANHVSDATLQLETFDKELIAWARATYGTSGTPVYLLGFSKAALGAQGLILRNPALVQKAASWDFPAQIQDVAGTDPSAPGGVWSSLATIMVTNYGTGSPGTAWFQAQYELSPANLTAWAAADPTLTTATRLWIGGYADFQADLEWYTGTGLPGAGILAASSWMSAESHAWHADWVAAAVAWMAGAAVRTAAATLTAAPALSASASAGPPARGAASLTAGPLLSARPTDTARGAVHLAAGSSLTARLTDTAVRAALSASPSLSCSYLSARITISAISMFQANGPGVYGPPGDSSTVVVPGVIDGVFDA